jgi:hypothetical protein
MSTSTSRGVGQDRGRGGQPGQQRGGDGIKLADVAEAEQPQETPQCRGCPHPGEQPTHSTVAQQIQVGDRVRAGDHPSDQGEDLHRGVRRDRDPVGQQRVQPTPLGQRHHRNQPRARHEIRIVEPRVDRAVSVR